MDSSCLDNARSVVRHLAIVAGGAGTRLASVSGNLPKALVSIGDKPVLQHQIEWAVAHGIDEITVFAGQHAKAIRDFSGDGSRFRVKIRVRSEEAPLGNAWAIVHSLDDLPPHFFVLYGDLMLGVDLERMGNHHVQEGADLTALVHPNDHPYDSDLIESDAYGRVTAIHCYPHAPDRVFSNLVNSGLYVVRKEALNIWFSTSRKLDFVKDVMRDLLAGGRRVSAYRSTEYIKDMGTPERLASVVEDWNTGKISAPQPYSAICLDRDGVLNYERGYLRSASEFELIPGVAQSLRILRQSGFLLVVLTNQPVIARGEASEADVAAIHRRLEWELGKEGAYLDAIYLCPHHPDRGFPGERADLKISCSCRKPGTGLFERARQELSIDADTSWMIGDQHRDIEMARKAGLRSVLIRTGVSGSGGPTPDYVARNIEEATRFILRHAHL